MQTTVIPIKQDFKSFLIVTIIFIVAYRALSYLFTLTLRSQPRVWWWPPLTIWLRDMGRVNLLEVHLRKKRIANDDAKGA